MTIPDDHKLSLDSTVRNHNQHTNLARLRELYAVAAGEVEGKKEPRANVIPSRLEATNAQHGSIIIGTGTDEQTGVYVQLAKTEKQLLMTVGQKWVIQQPNAQGTLVTVHR